MTTPERCKQFEGEKRKICVTSYGHRGKVAFKKISPIKHKTAQIAMIILGLATMMIGALAMGYDISPYLISYFGFSAVIISLSEIGFKLLTKWSTLKTLGGQQIAGLIITFFVLISSILTLPQISFSIPIISDFTGGFIFVSGLYIIIEAWW